MNAFSEKLRKEREARGITLASIAKQTRINIKYLEAIEQGAFDVLPQTYVRAFIKSYAESTGLPAHDILHQYDIIVAQKYSQQTATAVSDEQSAWKPTPEKDETIQKEKKIRLIFFSIVIIFAGTITALYLLNWFDARSYDQPVSERSFQEVVKEREEIAVPVPVKDSAKITKQIVATPVVRKDSLWLRIYALDSVWITVVRDSLPARRGYLSKGRYKTYSARNEFTISLNNAGLAKLFLSGTELQPLADSGKAVYRRKITAAYLRQ